MQRKTVTLKTVYVRDALAEGGFRHSRNRQETYSRKPDAVRLVTTHARHTPDANGNRYTITQTATASNPETLAKWADGSRGEFSADGLTFTMVTEI